MRKIDIKSMFIGILVTVAFFLVLSNSAPQEYVGRYEIEMCTGRVATDDGILIIDTKTGHVKKVSIGHKFTGNLENHIP